MVIFTLKLLGGNIYGRDHGCIYNLKYVTLGPLLLLVVGLSFGWIHVYAVDVWMIWIYFDVFRLMFGRKTFGQNRHGIEPMVDDLNMVMASLSL